MSPRWRVAKCQCCFQWAAWRPGVQRIRWFGTWRDAYGYARIQARLEAVKP